ncbi:MAG: tetratricopeptide repeat protein [Candidatus Heimdallarchaeota archaeon]|nr:tetratricopeptide repeat protein [Candidatus Heimdallarchaeota archaeon]
MSSFKDSNMQLVAVYLQQGKNKEALDILSKIKDIDKLTTQEQLFYLLFKSKIKSNLGNYQEGLSLAEELAQKSQELEQHNFILYSILLRAENLLRLNHPQESLEVIKEGEELASSEVCQSYPDFFSQMVKLAQIKGSIYYMQGEAFEALKAYQEGLEYAKKSENKIDIATSYVHLGIINWGRRDVDKALEYYLQALPLLKELDKRDDLGRVLSNIGTAYYTKGDLDQALKHYEESLDYLDRDSHKTEFATILNNIASIHRVKGNLDLALKNYQESLGLFQELENKQYIALIYNNLGLIYSSQGDWEKALDYYNEGLALMKELESKQNAGSLLNNIGNIHRMKGELDIALEKFKESLQIWIEMVNKEFEATTILNIGKVYFHKANVEIAQDYFEESLSLYRELGNNLNIATSLYNLILVTLAKRAYDQALNYLQQFKEFNEQVESSVIDQQYRLAKALVLKSSERSNERVEAEKILREITNEEIINAEITIQAILNLCEFLLSKLKQSRDPKILRELEAYIDQVEDLAKKNNSFYLLVETYWLQSQLAIIQFEVEKAKECLQLANEIAQEKKMNRLLKKIDTDYRFLHNQIENWEEIFKKQPSLIDRLEKSHIEMFIVRMHKQQKEELIDLPQESPTFLFIFSEEGKPIYFKNFEKEMEYDDSLISNFLVGINSFINNTYSTSGLIDHLEEKDYVLIFNAKKPFIFCYVFTGNSFPAMRRFDQFTQKVLSSEDLWENILEQYDTTQSLGTEEYQQIEQFAQEVFQ